jgi:hypothetical protein
MRRRGLTAGQVDDAIHLYNLGWSLKRGRRTPERRPDHRADQTAGARRPHPRHTRTTTIVNRSIAEPSRSHTVRLLSPREPDIVAGRRSGVGVGIPTRGDGAITRSAIRGSSADDQSAPVAGRGRQATSRPDDRAARAASARAVRRWVEHTEDRAGAGNTPHHRPQGTQAGGREDASTGGVRGFASSMFGAPNLGVKVAGNYVIPPN